ncbi:MAG: hypothetical protein KDA98_08720 [Acidimicrobiales bacterium]|nr:hypothetical protein [Acidimicrobiales bacterium]
MPEPDLDAVVAALDRRYGRTFASEAGIRLERNTPAPLFQLLVWSLLVSARIRGDIATAALRALVDAGLTTPQAMVEASWEERTALLNGAGYARYDESTARYLEATAQLLLHRDGGDLRRLRERAEGDRGVLVDELTEFTGIGEVGATTFLREVQAVWDEVGPVVDQRAARAAEALGLPGDPDELRALVDDAPAFARLVAALVRCDLDDGADAVLDDASG